MWTFTLLEEHSENLEFCSPGNSQVKHPFFISSASPWTPKLLDMQSCLYPLPSGRARGSPSEIRDPRAAKPLCFGTYHQALQEPDPVGFAAAPWGPWSPSSSGWGWGGQVFGAHCSTAWQAGWQEAGHPCL